jgi:PAS domain S-box-containing protein
VTWLVLAAFAALLAVIAVLVRRTRAQEDTIRRQVARETSLKARFDDLFERVSDILIVHDREGRITSVNRAAERVTGYTRDELRVLDPNWIVDQAYLDMVRRLLEGGPDGEPRTTRTELQPRKGQKIPVEVDARVLTGDGQAVGLTAIVRDLSEQSRLEAELRQAQKMEAVGRLATGIAHDFNNLITVLLGYSDELIESVPADSDWRKPVEEIRRATERASSLTQQLLAFSRRQASVSQAVDLNAVIANMEDMLRRLLGAEIRLSLQLAEGLGAMGAIRADAPQIGQILMNLAVNARDAMPNGGALMIETANMQLGPEHLDIVPGPHVMLAVTDSGTGMTADVQKRLFEPFFTTKGAGQGTGLGLSMVQAIVRQNGGHITVQSEPGHGSTFRIYFPRANEEAAPLRPVLPARPQARGSGVVLLAEDDRSVRRLVVTELTRRGFEVIEAPDGRVALELAQSHEGRIDVLVTDVVMPRMNGADLAKAMAGVRPEVKILFISGHPERAGAGLDPTGVPNLLMKPFTADTLAAKISELVAARG